MILLFLEEDSVGGGWGGELLLCFLITCFIFHSPKSSSAIAFQAFCTISTMLTNKSWLYLVSQCVI